METIYELAGIPYFYMNGAFFKAAKQEERGERLKRLIYFHGLKLGISHDAGDMRNGHIVRDPYGCIHGSASDGEDGMAIDFWLGRDFDSKKIYRAKQMRDGEFEQFKYIFGCSSPKDAKALFLRNRPASMFGGVEECGIGPLRKYQKE